MENKNWIVAFINTTNGQRLGQFISLEEAIKCAKRLPVDCPGKEVGVYELIRVFKLNSEINPAIEIYPQNKIPTSEVGNE